MRVGRSGAVLEPASGAFDVTVAPGEDVQAAVNRCRRGGSVLLLPGTHEGPLELGRRKEAHMFGRGQAVLRTVNENALTIDSVVATVDGLVVRCEDDDEEGDEGGNEDGEDDIRTPKHGVWIRGGRARLQACDVAAATHACICIDGGDPIITSCTCVLGWWRTHSGSGTFCRIVWALPSSLFSLSSFHAMPCYLPPHLLLNNKSAPSLRPPLGVVGASSAPVKYRGQLFHCPVQ